MRLRYIRIDNDKYQYNVAKDLNVAKCTYSVWETEQSTIPLKRLVDFCNLFDVSVDYALGLTDFPKYPDMRCNIDYELYAYRIKKTRQLNNYTQASIAKLLNTDNGVISRYEKGKTLILTTFLIEYAKIFKVSTDYLLGRIDEKIMLNIKEDKKQPIRN